MINDTKLLITNYEPKDLITTFYIFKGTKWMNNQSHSSKLISYLLSLMLKQLSYTTYNFSFFNYIIKFGILYYIISFGILNLIKFTYLISHYY